MTLLATTACFVFSASAAMALDRAELQKMTDRYVSALEKGDAATFVSQYKDDAVVLPPDAQMLNGKTEIEKFWKDAAEGVSDVKITVTEVKPLGPTTARDIGTFSFKTKAQPPQNVTGKYVVIWEKVGNDWKNTTDIWNMNPPSNKQAQN
jgi:uncharacterized protein (TIGR02246 family)